MLIEPTLPKYILAIWRIHFLAISITAVTWSVSTPHGFPLSHPLFWCNTTIPVIVLGFCIMAIYSILKNKTSLFLIFAISFLNSGFALLITASFFFPKTMRPSISFLLLSYLILLALTLGKKPS
jgi:hypothetical protein